MPIKTCYKYQSDQILSKKLLIINTFLFIVT